MTGRERFEAAVRGDGLAFVAHVWERLPELVHQPGDDWWRDAGRGWRLLQDAAGIAGADGMVVDVARAAVAASADDGERGADVLDGLAGSEGAKAAFAFVGTLVGSAPFAALGALPGLAELERALGDGDEDAADAAEDALADLARGLLDAGADGLIVLGDDPGDVTATTERLGGIAGFYRRPLLGFAAGAGRLHGSDVPVGVVGADGAWPAQTSGVVLTPGDVSARWDPERLHAVGRARP